jgi:hypothetical protein
VPSGEFATDVARLAHVVGLDVAHHVTAAAAGPHVGYSTAAAVEAAAASGVRGIDARSST